MHTRHCEVEKQNEVVFGDLHL